MNIISFDETTGQVALKFDDTDQFVYYQLPTMSDGTYPVGDTLLEILEKVNPNSKPEIQLGSNPEDIRSLVKEQPVNTNDIVRPNPPERTVADEVRQRRDALIGIIAWRMDRYRNQKDLGIETTDNSEKYQQLLQYVEQLRKIPEQKGFPDNVYWPTEPL